MCKSLNSVTVCAGWTWQEARAESITPLLSKHHPVTFKASDSVVAIISFWIYKEKKMVWFFISPFQWIEAHLCFQCGVSEPSIRCSSCQSLHLTLWWDDGEMHSSIANTHACFTVPASACFVLIYKGFQELDQLKGGRDASRRLSFLNAWRWRSRDGKRIAKELSAPLLSVLM